MKKDTLIQIRIMSKEWQIKHSEIMIEGITKLIDEQVAEIELLGDDAYIKAQQLHFSLRRKLKEIDKEKESLCTFKQELEKLHTRLDDLTGGAKR